MRYYDQPPGSDRCATYEAMMAQVRRGRVAAVIPIKPRNGTPAAYIYSGVADNLNADNTFHVCVEMVVGARKAAREDGCTPLP